MTTNIVIDIFNRSNQRISTINIHNTIYNNDEIDADEIFYNKDGSIYHQSKIHGADEEFIMDQYFSNTSNVVGEHSIIHINSLSNEDKKMFTKLFSKQYEIPDCVEFDVFPSVGLTNLPKIHADSGKDVCPICLGDLRDEPVSYISGNKANVAYCNHQFHTRCIHEYCSKQETCLCPLCRRKIDYGDIRQLGGVRLLGMKKKKRTSRKYSRTRSKREKKSKKRYSRRHMK